MEHACSALMHSASLPQRPSTLPTQSRYAAQAASTSCHAAASPSGTPLLHTASNFIQWATVFSATHGAQQKQKPA